MVIKVATSVINSDKLSHSYDDLYLVLGHRVLRQFKQ